MATAEECKALVQRYIAAINAGDLAALDKIIAAEFVDHNGFPGQSPGREGAKDLVRVYRTAFPDVQWTIEDQIAEENKVMTRWIAQGTHLGNLFGVAPTGRRVRVEGIGIDWVRDGQLAEGWLSFDQFGLLRQIGALPLPDDD
jgi:steroid delta-isomerase-like uncharacterized protein